MTETSTFQRARRPEHITKRREAILRAAEDLLAERSIYDLTLRQIADHAGLAPSGLLRYFDSREAIFVEVLYRKIDGWLDDFAAALNALPSQPDSLEHARDVARLMARTLLDHALLGELISASASVLEANIGIELMRDFKKRLAGIQTRIATLVSDHVPGLGQEAARMFSAGASVILAGAWPHTRPTETAQQAMTEMNCAAIYDDVPRFLGEMLASYLVGVLVSQPGFEL